MSQQQSHTVSGTNFLPNGLKHLCTRKKKKKAQNKLFSNIKTISFLYPSHYMLSIALLFLVNENITNNLTCQKIMNPSKKIDYLPVQPLSSHHFMIETSWADHTNLDGNSSSS